MAAIHYLGFLKKFLNVLLPVMLMQDLCIIKSYLSAIRVIIYDNYNKIIIT